MRGEPEHNDRVTSAQMWFPLLWYSHDFRLFFVAIALLSGFPHLAWFWEEASLCIGNRITGCCGIDNNSKGAKYQDRCSLLGLEILLIAALMYYSGQRCEAESSGIMGITAPLCCNSSVLIQYNTQ